MLPTESCEPGSRKGLPCLTPRFSSRVICEVAGREQATVVHITNGGYVRCGFDLALVVEPGITIIVAGLSGKVLSVHVVVPTGLELTVLTNCKNNSS